MSFRKIGIIGAMEEEVELLLHHMINSEQSAKAGILFTTGSLQEKAVVVCRCGVGKVNAAVATQIMVDLYQVDAIVFTGVAGALDPLLEIGDIVISQDCVQHDMDATALGYPRGVIPFQDRWIFTADDRLTALAYNAAVDRFGTRVSLGRVLSGDRFIADRTYAAELRLQFSGDCAEMEGAAVAQVCAMNEVPYVVIRAMSDKADGSAHISFAEFTALASRNSFELVQEMLKRMQQ